MRRSMHASNGMAHRYTQNHKLAAERHALFSRMGAKREITEVYQVSDLKSYIAVFRDSFLFVNTIWNLVGHLCGRGYA